MDIKTLLSSVDLIDLANRAGARMKQNGRGATSVCPLHSGADNPTAFVIKKDKDGEQYWHCYTRCHDGGDAIDFMHRWKGLDFLEAVKELASMYHVDVGDLHTRDMAAENTRRLRSDVLTLAAAFYRQQMYVTDQAARNARTYLRRRGFTVQTIKATGWGYSNGTGLVAYLEKHSGNLAIAHEIGLLRRDGLDFTANRDGQKAAPHGYIVIPHIEGERVVSFSSRAVEVPGSPRPEPTDKSRNLPGTLHLYKADVSGQYDRVILVEGAFDAESLRQAGSSAWAMCGLSGKLEPADLAALKRRDQVHIATDSDAAGAEALTKQDGKVALLATAIGPLTMIMPPLAQGKDFNGALQLGTLDAAMLASMQKDSVTWLEKRIDQARDCQPNELDERVNEVGRMLAAIPEGARSRFYKIVSNRLGLGRKDIQALISKDRNNGHILGAIRDGQLTFAGKPLGNFQARISHELMVDDGQNPPAVRFTITGGLMTGQPLETVDVPAEEFSGLKWIPKHWGARPVLYGSSGSYYEVARAIQEVSGEMKRERVHTYTGWTVNGDTRSYLSGSGMVTAEGLDETVRVDLGVNNLRFYNLPAPPTGEALFQAGQASLDFLHAAPRIVTAPLWAAMYAAPLTSLAPLYCVLWVYGPTQSGKSTVTHLALTHYGPAFIQGRQYHAPKDWMSTVTDLEGAMFAIKDAPLVIDDFAPQFASAADSRDMHKRAHYVVRSVGNRSSRGRARADLSERTTRVPRGLVIATAENPLIGQGIVGRMLYVNVQKTDLFSTENLPNLVKAQEQGQAGLYAQAMAAYIQYLIQNWKRISEQLPGMIEASSQIIRQEHPELQNRLPDYFGILHAAQTIALRCWQDLGVLPDLKAGNELEASKQALIKIIVDQAAQIAQESPVKKFIEALSSLLERSKAYLAPSTKCDVQKDPPLHADLIGWYNPRDEGVVYISTDIALAMTKAYWRDLDENLDILPDALRRMIDQAGLLKEKDTGHIEVVKWIQGKSRRVLCLDIKAIRNLFQVTIGNEIDQPPEQEPIDF